jgi:hypothetical protein
MQMLDRGGEPGSGPSQDESRDSAPMEVGITDDDIPF